MAERSTSSSDSEQRNENSSRRRPRQAVRPHLEPIVEETSPSSSSPSGNRMNRAGRRAARRRVTDFNNNNTTLPLTVRTISSDEATSLQSTVPSSSNTFESIRHEDTERNPNHRNYSTEESKDSSNETEPNNTSPIGDECVPNSDAYNRTYCNQIQADLTLSKTRVFFNKLGKFPNTFLKKNANYIQHENNLVRVTQENETCSSDQPVQPSSERPQSSTTILNEEVNLIYSSSTRQLHRDSLFHTTGDYTTSNLGNQYYFSYNPEYCFYHSRAYNLQVHGFAGNGPVYTPYLQIWRPVPGNTTTVPLYADVYPLSSTHIEEITEAQSTESVAGNEREDSIPATTSVTFSLNQNVSGIIDFIRTSLVQNEPRYGSMAISRFITSILSVPMICNQLIGVEVIQVRFWSEDEYGLTIFRSDTDFVNIFFLPCTDYQCCLCRFNNLVSQIRRGNFISMEDNDQPFRIIQFMHEAYQIFRTCNRCNGRMSTCPSCADIESNNIRSSATITNEEINVLPLQLKNIISGRAITDQNTGDRFTTDGDQSNSDHKSVPTTSMSNQNIPTDNLGAPQTNTQTGISMLDSGPTHEREAVQGNGYVSKSISTASSAPIQGSGTVQDTGHHHSTVQQQTPPLQQRTPRSTMRGRRAPRNPQVHQQVHSQRIRGPIRSSVPNFAQSTYGYHSGSGIVSLSQSYYNTLSLLDPIRYPGMNNPNTQHPQCDQPSMPGYPFSCIHCTGSVTCCPSPVPETYISHQGNNTTPPPNTNSSPIYPVPYNCNVPQPIVGGQTQSSRWSTENNMYTPGSFNYSIPPPQVNSPATSAVNWDQAGCPMDPRLTVEQQVPGCNYHLVPTPGYALFGHSENNQTSNDTPQASPINPVFQQPFIPPYSPSTSWPSLFRKSPYTKLGKKHKNVNTGPMGNTQTCGSPKLKHTAYNYQKNQEHRPFQYQRQNHRQPDDKNKHGKFQQHQQSTVMSEEVARQRDSNNLVSDPVTTQPLAGPSSQCADQHTSQTMEDAPEASSSQGKKNKKKKNKKNKKKDKPQQDQPPQPPSSPPPPPPSQTA